jgi:hypothetical protein
MSIFDKLAFWKKDDDFDSLGPDLGVVPVEDNLGLGEKSPFAPQQPDPMHEFNTPAYPQQPVQPSIPQQQSIGTQQGSNQDLELISSKLDTLKALLTSLEQRMANLERVAGVEQKKQVW